MRYILFTGGAGFIGSSMCERLLEDAENFIVITDNLYTGKIENLPKKHTDRYFFVKCDVNNYRDISELFFSFPFEYIFHYSAVVGVKRTLENPIKVLSDIKGIENICNLAKNSKVKRIFFSSSSEVYGEPVEFPQNEDTTPLNSKLPYAIVKNVGEAFLRAFYQEHNLKYIIFRFFNTYGPKQSSDFVVARFINFALKNEPITIYGDGTQSRTFCYIDDNIEATYNVFQEVCKNSNYPSEIINIGSDVEYKIIDLAQIILKLTKSSSKIVYLPALPEGDMKRRLPDIRKMKRFLKRKMITLEEGIEKILQSIKSNS